MNTETIKQIALMSFMFFSVGIVGMGLFYIAYGYDNKVNIPKRIIHWHDDLSGSFSIPYNSIDEVNEVEIWFKCERCNKSYVVVNGQIYEKLDDKNYTWGVLLNHKNEKLLLNKTDPE